MKMQKLILNKMNALLLVGGLLLTAGCMGEDEEPAVAYDPNDSVEGDRNEDTKLTYDTDFDANASFNYNLEGLPFVGVNMSGPEWDGGASQTQWPNQYLTEGYASFLKYFRGLGMTTIRLPFKWEYLQPQLGEAFDEEEFEQLKTTVFWARKYRAKIIIDMHNYARFRGDLIGSENVTYGDYANVWTRLANTFKNYPEVMFGIMNEPHDMPTADWVTAANAAINAIRNTGAKNLIFINGNGWSGAHSWYQTWTDFPADETATKQSNAQAMLQIVDPLGDDYLIFEVHQYLNENSSDWGVCQCSEWEASRGVSDEYPVACTNETVGSYRMQRFTQWLRDNNKKGFLGEFGVNDSSTCLAAMDDHLRHIEENDDVYVGWTWWSAGPGCASWQRPIDPYCWDEEHVADFEQNGVDGNLVYPQLKVLADHL